MNQQQRGSPPMLLENNEPIALSSNDLGGQIQRQAEKALEEPLK